MEIKVNVTIQADIDDLEFKGHKTKEEVVDVFIDDLHQHIEASKLFIYMHEKDVKWERNNP